MAIITKPNNNPMTIKLGQSYFRIFFYPKTFWPTLGMVPACCQKMFDLKKWLGSISRLKISYPNEPWHVKVYKQKYMHIDRPIHGR